jgi:hypothetical protein
VQLFLKDNPAPVKAEVFGPFDVILFRATMQFESTEIPDIAFSKMKLSVIVQLVESPNIP